MQKSLLVNKKNTYMNASCSLFDKKANWEGSNSRSLKKKGGGGDLLNF